MNRSKNDLMYALLDVMGEKEYSLIKVTDICRSAGYNRSTFYKYYYEKGDLLKEIIEVKLNELVTTLKKLEVVFPSQDRRTSQDKVRAIIPLFEFIYENRYFFKVVLTDNKIEGFRNQMYYAYREYIGQSIEVPFEESHSDPAIHELYLHFISASWLGIVIYWINEGTDKTAEYVTEQFVKITTTRPHDVVLGKIPFQSIFDRDNQPIDPRIFRTKKALKQALIMLMKQQNYASIRIHDISELANYHRSTFYSHYQDKDELYQDILVDLINGFSASISAARENQAMNTNEPPLPILNFFTFIYINRELLGVMYSDKKIPGSFNKIFCGMHRFFKHELETHSDLDIDIDIYCNFLTSTLMIVVGIWFEDNMKYSPLFLARAFSDMLQKG